MSAASVERSLDSVIQEEKQRRKEGSKAGPRGLSKNRQKPSSRQAAPLASGSRKISKFNSSRRPAPRFAPSSRDPLRRTGPRRIANGLRPSGTARKPARPVWAASAKAGPRVARRRPPQSGQGRVGPNAGGARRQARAPLRPTGRARSNGPNNLSEPRANGSAAKGGVGQALASQTDRRKLLVSNFNDSITDKDLYDLFSDIGPLRVCKIARNSIGRSLGKAKVIYARDADARKAINKYHNSKLDEKRLRVVLYSKQSQTRKPQQNPREPEVPRVNRKITKGKRDSRPRVQGLPRDSRRGRAILGSQSTQSSSRRLPSRNRRKNRQRSAEGRLDSQAKRPDHVRSQNGQRRRRPRRQRREGEGEWKQLGRLAETKVQKLNEKY